MGLGFRLLPLVTMACIVQAAAAQEWESPHERDCNYAYMLMNEDGSKPTAEQHVLKEQREAECRRNRADRQKRAVSARARLKSEFQVDGSSMSDREAIARLDQEIAKKAEAEREASERRAEAAEQERMKQVSAALKQQDQKLKGLGYKLRTAPASDDDEGSDDEELDAAELQGYQQMVDNGAAPQCKGKKGAALIDCVDAVLDAEE